MILIDVEEESLCAKIWQKVKENENPCFPFFHVALLPKMAKLQSVGKSVLESWQLGSVGYGMVALSVRFVRNPKKLRPAPYKAFLERYSKTGQLSSEVI